MNKRLATVAVASLLGCATSHAMRDNVRKRAAFDLNCTEDKIQVTEIESPANSVFGALGSWGARGCGKQATYVQDKPSSRTVIMNSPVAPDGSGK